MDIASYNEKKKNQQMNERNFESNKHANTLLTGINMYIYTEDE